MEWSDHLLTGNDLVDRQHMDIMRIVSAFHESVRHGGGILRTQFSTLLAAVERHCSYEEELLKKSSRYKYGRHKKAHTVLLNNIRSLCIYLETKPLNPYTGDFIISETTNWMIDHIRQQDKDFVEDTAIHAVEDAPIRAYAVALRK